jgi:hypothetical protein
MNMLGRRTICNLIVSIASAIAICSSSAFADDELYGPPNLLKSMKTPFGFSQEKSSDDKNTLRPMSLGPGAGRTLSNRLLPPRLYLPGRMVIGQPAEFIIKGRPGAWVALAMADRDSGAKPILGKEVNLGPDRKVVSIGEIPESGVLSLAIETPIQGDLIGQQLYFAAAIWTKPDFSDVELATPVPSDTTTVETTSSRPNGVTIAAESDKKRGIRFVPDGLVPVQALPGAGSTLNSGRP